MFSGIGYEDWVKDGEVLRMEGLEITSLLFAEPGVEPSASSN